MFRVCFTVFPLLHLHLRNEYFSAEEVPSTGVQTHLPCGKISALIFYKGTCGGEFGRYFSTIRKVAGSISDGVIGIFHALILPVALLPWG
jgi:hypothetical protein